ncbi:hypothetical protein KTH_06030 [Thermosporothrix hazakensis]|nr:hypothetical protein KTH_06030 [Thermosporothrix hazakensis]
MGEVHRRLRPLLYLVISYDEGGELYFVVRPPAVCPRILHPPKIAKNPPHFPPLQGMILLGSELLIDPSVIAVVQ